MLSRLAAAFAAEIKNHYWGDAHKRIDRAGHQPGDDKKPAQSLDVNETESVLINVVFVTMQVLKYLDPNLNLHEYALACGVSHGIARTGWISEGLRTQNGMADSPGRSLE